MSQLKAGSRLKSAVCATEVMVIAAPEAGGTVTCGGVPMLDVASDRPDGVAIDPDAKGGTQIGKRYVGESGELELLCTKPGEGSLGVGATPLEIKSAKPLPSSD